MAVTINGTTGIANVDGSAGSPAFRNTDANSGIAGSADQVIISTAGSERLRLASAGQLGIAGANYGTDGQVLTSTGASSAPAWEAAGGGVILQVVSIAQQSSSFETTGTGSEASGYTGAITPTSSGNKVLVQLSGRLMLNSSDAHAAAYLKDVTNGTFSAQRTAIGRASGSEEHYTIWHLFTTASGSSHTYEMYQHSADGGSKVWNEAQMLLWEIAV